MGIAASAKAMTFICTRDRDRSKTFYRDVPGFGLTHEDDFDQDALGIWTAPGSSAKGAWFNDSGGNVLSLAQL